jgi:hypothetical protein
MAQAKVAIPSGQKPSRANPDHKHEADEPPESPSEHRPNRKSSRKNAKDLAAASDPPNDPPKRATVKEPASGAPRVHIEPRQAARIAVEAEPRGGQLELLQALNQIDQRRTIVSVRLTEEEFACLRDRAEESGISVSAYMRSCVVDAEQLRAQVKQALAEMRSLTASPATGQIPALTVTSRAGVSAGAWSSQSWFRLVMRPFTLLFGPLFPARRSA